MQITSDAFKIVFLLEVSKSNDPYVELLMEDFNIMTATLFRVNFKTRHINIDFIAVEKEQFSVNPPSTIL